MLRMLLEPLRLMLEPMRKNKTLKAIVSHEQSRFQYLFRQLGGPSKVFSYNVANMRIGSAYASAHLAKEAADKWMHDHA